MQVPQVKTVVFTLVLVELLCGFEINIELAKL